MKPTADEEAMIVELRLLPGFELTGDEVIMLALVGAMDMVSESSELEFVIGVAAVDMNEDDFDLEII